jgi:hypothetical protein
MCEIKEYVDFMSLLNSYLSLLLLVVQPFNFTYQDFIRGFAKFSSAKGLRGHINFGNSGLSQHQEFTASEMQAFVKWAVRL